MEFLQSKAHHPKPQLPSPCRWLSLLHSSSKSSHLQKERLTGLKNYSSFFVPVLYSPTDLMWLYPYTIHAIHSTPWIMTVFLPKGLVFLPGTSSLHSLYSSCSPFSLWKAMRVWTLLNQCFVLSITVTHSAYSHIDFSFEAISQRAMAMWSLDRKIPHKHTLRG